MITVAIPHLKDIDILDVQVKAVSVLIGKDVDYAHEVFEVRKPSSPDNHLKTLRGSLWWVVTGVVVGHPSSKGISVNFTNCKKKLCEFVEAFWKLEAFGRQGAPWSREGKQVNRLSALHNWSMEDMRTVKTLRRTTRLSDGRYETGLLWRNEDVWLPNNHCEAKRRKCSLKRRVSRDWISSRDTVRGWRNTLARVMPVSSHRKKLLTLSFQTSEFWLYLSKHWNSVVIFSHLGIFTLSVQTLEFWPYPFRYWNSGLICPNIRILTISIHTLKWSPFLSTPWNSDLIRPNIGILALSFQTLEFSPYLSKHWNSVLIFSHLGIFTLSVQTLEFRPYPFWYWNSGLICPNIRILTLSFQPLEFWPYLSKQWNSNLILPNIGILALSVLTMIF